MSSRPGLGYRKSPTILVTPATTSAGLFTLWNLASLKKSELSSCRMVTRMSYPEATKASAMMLTATGSFGGVWSHAGTCTSSATKKL